MAFIRKTLRMFPVAPIVPKGVHADTVLPGTYFTFGSRNTPVETGNF